MPHDYATVEPTSPVPLSEHCRTPPAGVAGRSVSNGWPPGTTRRRWLSGAAAVVAVVLGKPRFAAEEACAEPSRWPHLAQLDRFRFHADFPIAPQQVLFQELVDLNKQLQRHLRLPGSQEPIDVYLFHDQGVYQQYMRRYFPTVQSRRAMYIKTNSPGNVFAYDSEDIAVDLRHECTHAVLHACLPYVPLWLDEGLAEYFELPGAHRASEHLHLRSVRRSIRWRRPRELTELEALERLDQMGASEYRDSWAWVHFMLHGPAEARAELRAYLYEIARLAKPAPLSSRLRQQFADLDEAFASHFRNDTFLALGE